MTSKPTLRAIGAQQAFESPLKTMAHIVMDVLAMDIRFSAFLQAAIQKNREEQIRLRDELAARASTMVQEILPSQCDGAPYKVAASDMVTTTLDGLMIGSVPSPQQAVLIFKSQTCFLVEALEQVQQEVEGQKFPKPASQGQLRAAPFKPQFVS